MKISIDISQVIYGTGVSVYTKNIVSNLIKIDKKNDYLLFGYSLRRQKELRNFISSFGVVKSKVFPLAPGWADVVWNNIHTLPIEKLIGIVDVFHSSDWVQPPARAFKVTTVHDLSPIIHPQFTPRKIVEVHSRRLKWVIKEVDRVIVPSLSTKNTAIEVGIKEEKLRVIPEANDPIFEKKMSDDEIKKINSKYSLGEYLLAIGTGPRKNTSKIIEAFRQVCEKNPDLKLAIVGEKSSVLSQDKNIVYTGHVNEKEIVGIYQGAHALVYTSLDEGFGLPILHAFSTQTPVVTSNISSMPEVCADAAIKVDPYRADSIAEGIQKALKNKGVLVKRGLKRLRDFSWEEAALATLQVYGEA